MMHIIEISFYIASLSIFFNYIIGKPGSEKFSPYEIFSFYSVWLARRRLKHEGENKYTDEFNNTAIRKEYETLIFNEAEPNFTWERAVGMCVVCTGFWFAVIIGIIDNPLHLPFLIIISHIFIRVLNKLV